METDDDNKILNKILINDNNSYLMIIMIINDKIMMMILKYNGKWSLIYDNDKLSCLDDKW